MTKPDFRPAYQRILEELTEKISSGELAPGDALPSEDELARQHGVSRSSVRGAIRILRESGVVEVRRPLGTFVRRPPVRTVRAPSHRYQWEKDRARLPLDQRITVGVSERESGLDTEDLHFSAEFDQVPAPDDVAAELKLPAGTLVLQRTYETKSKDSETVIGRSHSYLPLSLIKSNPELLDPANEPWPGGTQHQLFTVGIEVDRICDSITTRMPDMDEKSRLSIPEGTPVFEIHKLSIDIEDRPVELSKIVLPADRSELRYTVQLHRWE